VRKNLETRLTQTFGLKTRIGSIGLSPLRGRLTIKNLTIENPGGFTSEHLFSLKSGTIHMDIFSPWQNIISIDAITLRGLMLNAEQRKNGFNLDYLKKEVRKSSGHKKHTPDLEPDHSEKADTHDERTKRLFRVGSLAIKKIEVNFSAEQAGIKSIHFKLPNLVIDQLSEPDEDPITLDELLYRIMSAVIDKLSAQGPGNYQNAIKKFLMEQLRDFYKR
jgi:uncharacterized protein involved in outer membrane biogenesis